MEEINKEELEYISQMSEQWRLDRIGRFTASEFHRLMADAKRPMTEDELASRPPKSLSKTIVDPTLLSDGAITYIEEVAGEILTGESADSDYTSKDMEHGILYEPTARKLYERVMEVKVNQVGSISYRPLEGYVSGSPDGVITMGNQTVGGIEIKCPAKNAIHFANLKLENVWQFKDKHKDYYFQCLGGMLLTGAKYWDFVSYNPFFPFRLQLHTVRINSNEVIDDIRLLAIKLKAAVTELKRSIEQFKED